MQPLSISLLPTETATTLNVEPRLPTLFGRLTLLLGAHERQLATIENLRAMCNAIEAGQASLPPELEPNRLLSELGCELSVHFAAEESPAHFGAMARMRPELLPQVVDLKADHGGLQRALSRIELVATDRNRRTELPALVSSLLVELADHELAEADLVERFLS